MLSKQVTRFQLFRLLVVFGLAFITSVLFCDAVSADTIEGDPPDLVGVLLGDVNQDDVVNFFDIQPFIECLASGTYHPAADLDSNGCVKFFDIPLLIPFLPGL